MRVAALLPQPRLSKYLEDAFSNGSEKLQNEGFNQTASLTGKIPLAVRQAVLKRLADEILSAKDTSALLRVEALVARLPRDLGAEYVQRRRLLLWRYTKIVDATVSLIWPNAIFDMMRRPFSPKRAKDTATLRVRNALKFGTAVVAYVPLFLSLSLLGKSGVMENALNIRTLIFGIPKDQYSWIDREPVVLQLILPGSLLVMLIYMTLPLLFRFRAEGDSISLRFFVRQLRNWKAIGEIATLLFIWLIVFGSITGIAFILGQGISFAASNFFNLAFSIPEIILGFGAIAILSIGTIAAIQFNTNKKKAKIIKYI